MTTATMETTRRRRITPLSKANRRRPGDQAITAALASRSQITGEALCEAMDIRSGQSVLDVAAGNGNASLAAARRFCKVVSTDYVPLAARTVEDSCHRREPGHRAPRSRREALPFDDASFDNVVSTFGVMFAPTRE